MPMVEVSNGGTSDITISISYSGQVSDSHSTSSQTINVPVNVSISDGTTTKTYTFYGTLKRWVAGNYYASCSGSDTRTISMS